MEKLHIIQASEVRKKVPLIILLAVNNPFNLLALKRLLLKYERKYLMKICKSDLTVILLLGFLFLVQYTFAASPEARPTYHCIGLYWRPDEGAADNQCHVFYRRAGSPNWQAAMPLWFDDQPHSGAITNTDQYRGSIVNLMPGTTYEIKLALSKTGTEEIITVATWSEDFKIKKIITMNPGESNESFRIIEGGSEAEGYVLYAPPEGKTSIIDVKGEENYCIKVEKSWVILRGLVLRGAKQHGIILTSVQNVVIENCDISRWGRSKENGWGENFDSAIYSSASGLEKIVIQRNKIHNPRSDANAWTENGHPEGPQGITFINGKGYYVIRYNEIWGDRDHYFNDSMGEYHNFSYAGFPNRDSDIYGNKISHCWDDAIEAEGANMNVRIWSNLLDSTYMALGLATTALGPLYVFRNVSHFSQRGPYPLEKYDRNGGFAKLGTENQEYTRGKMYFFHNTIAQPESPWGNPIIKMNGCEEGLGTTGSLKHQINITSRNNILHVNNYQKDKYSIEMTDKVASNDFDFDIYNGKIEAISGSEANGIKLNWDEAPGYDPGNELFEFFLSSNAAGYDDGQIIPNFNDGYEGDAPDIGAYETGLSALSWGVSADWTAWLSQIPVSVENNNSGPPVRFSLIVFPNPFNNTATVVYQLPSHNHVKISIFNVIGQKIVTFNCGKQTAGTHYFQWDATDLPSGTYFIQIKIDNLIEMKKCLLLR